MSYLLVRHQVADYARWKPVFDAHGAVRKASGAKGARIFRNARDPKEILVLVEWDDLEKARQFIESGDSRQVRQRAGVADTPDVYFLEEIEQSRA
jgi:heme-degrading monooxygenase HmoA